MAFLLALLISIVPSSDSLESGRNGDCHVASQRLGVEVISGEMLSASGATRLSDLFVLLSDWDRGTVEGFAWTASANGLGPARGSRYDIVVDGQPIEMHFPGTGHLNLLPVYLSEVECVEVISVPQLSGATFADKGLLHIHTRSPERGFTVATRRVLGQQTGDPGPFAWTRYATDNVDRLMNEGGWLASLAGRRWFVSGSLPGEWHVLTDPALFRRYQAAVTPGESMSLRGILPSVRAGVQTGRSAHTFFAGQANFGRDGNRDAVFFAPLSREIPIGRVFTHAGVSGSFSGFGKGGIAYSVTHSSSEMMSRSNQLNLNPDWEFKHTRGHVAISFAGGATTGRVGVEADRRNVVSSDRELGNSIAGALFGEMAFTGAERWVHTANVWLGPFGDYAAMKGALLSSFRLSSAQSLLGAISFSRSHEAREDDIWYWTSRGYGFLDSDYVDSTPFTSQEPDLQTTVDLGWRAEPGDNVGAELGVFGRAFRLHNMAEQSVRFDSEAVAFYTTNVLHSTAAGQVMGGRAEIEFGRGTALWQRAHIRLSQAVGGDDVFREAVDASPALRADYMLTVAPAPAFSVWGRVAYRSGSRFAAYGGLNTVEEKVPGAVIADLSLQKYLWDRRIRANVLFRNLLNREDRTHPLGIRGGLQYFFQIELRANL